MCDYNPFHALSTPPSSTWSRPTAATYNHESSQPPSPTSCSDSDETDEDLEQALHEAGRLTLETTPGYNEQAKAYIPPTHAPRELANRAVNEAKAAQFPQAFALMRLAFFHYNEKDNPLWLELHLKNFEILKLAGTPPHEIQAMSRAIIKLERKESRPVKPFKSKVNQLTGPIHPSPAAQDKPSQKIRTQTHSNACFFV